MVADEGTEEQLELAATTEESDPLRESLGARGELAVVSLVDLGLFVVVAVVFFGEEWVLRQLGMSGSTPLRVVGFLLKWGIAVNVAAVVLADQIRAWSRFRREVSSW